jgi:hypothetical protein
MKSYTTPQLTTLGAVEQLTLDKNQGYTGVTWAKPGSQNDPGSALTRVKVIN